jgi:hypothetical protein
MGLASRNETEVNDIRHPLTPKSMNIPKMRPPVLQEARRPVVQPATPTATSCQPIQDLSQEEFKRFDCGWRGCDAVLTNATILYVHVQTHHCVQACKVVTASSVRHILNVILSTHLIYRREKEQDFHANTIVAEIKDIYLLRNSWIISLPFILKG